MASTAGCIYGGLAVLVGSFGAAFFGAADTAQAVPVGVKWSAELSVSMGRQDSNNLDGAHIEVAYLADSDDSPTATTTHSSFTSTEFEFTMEVRINNRPGGASDVFQRMTRPKFAAVGNRFSTNDQFSLDSQGITVSGRRIDIGSLRLDLGSSSFFPGVDPVNDLSFLLGLPTDLTPLSNTPFVEVHETSTYDVLRFQLTNVSTNASAVPEPGSLAVLAAGLAGLGWAVRRRRRPLSTSTRHTCQRPRRHVMPEAYTD